MTEPYFDPWKKLYIADMKSYETFQERISDGVLLLQIYWPSNCNLHATADVPWDFFENFHISFF